MAVARDLQFGYEIGHDEVIGEDEYVLEKNVDEYNVDMTAFDLMQSMKLIVDLETR